MDIIVYMKDYFQHYFSWKYVILGGFGVGTLMLRRYCYGTRCPSRAEIQGKTVIITGASSGIGKATATELAKRKGRIILACRDVKLGEDAVQAIRKITKNGDLIVKKLDLASLNSIRSFCNEMKNEDKVDILINNAGIYQCPYMETEDGFEMQMGVNHLGHFYLTNLLLDKLKSSAPSRVVIVSSGLSKLGKIDFDNLNSEKEYKKNAAYYNSKLANNLFARELSKKLDGTGVSVFCMRPGMVRTNLARFMKIPPILRVILLPLAWILVKDAYMGCQTVVYCSVAAELEGETGKFYGNCQEERWSLPSLDDEVAQRLWDTSLELTRLS